MRNLTDLKRVLTPFLPFTGPDTSYMKVTGTIYVISITKVDKKGSRGALGAAIGAGQGKEALNEAMAQAQDATGGEQAGPSLGKTTV